MAAVPCSTPGEAVVPGGAQNPAAVNITIPADCTCVVLFWTTLNYSSGLGGIASVTLDGNAPTDAYELNHAPTYKVATGIAAWYSPATGTKALDIAWDQLPEEGPTCGVAYIKDGAFSVAASGLQHTENADACSTTLNGIASGHLVLKYDQKFGTTAPSLSSSWTNILTTTNGVNQAARLSYISATGTSQVCDSENEDFSTIAAIAFAPSGGAAAGAIPPGLLLRARSLQHLLVR